ncbi:MAG: hypothetical protein PVJ07_01340 [Anaerolineales bacterium]|jgi:hypothetical protein
MAITVLVHVSGEDPILGEMESLPASAESSVTISSPRRRDGKDLPYVQRDVVTVIWPWHRINFIEILPSPEEEKLIGPVRE